MSRALLISVLASSIGSFMTGFHLGVLNPIQEVLKHDLSLSGKNYSLISSVLIGAAAVGALLAGKAADKYGLKKSQETVAALFAAGAFVCAVSYGPAYLFIMLVGRILVGLACGACTVLQPRYMKDISPREWSGLLSSSMQLAVVLGLLVAFLCGIPYSGYKHELGAEMGSFGFSFSFECWGVAWWRVVLLLGTMISLTQIVALAHSEESPVWLGRRAQNREQDAAQARARLRIPRIDAAQEPLLPGVPPPVEVETLQQWLEQMQEIVSRQDYLYPSLLAVAVAVFQQLGGVNTVILYSTQIFKTCTVGTCGVTPIGATVLLGIVNVLSTVVAAFLVDRAGRKTLLIVSHGGCFASLSILALVVHNYGQDAAAGVILLTILAFIAFFALGCGPVPFMYVPEILPDEISSTVQSLALGLNWLFNFLVTASFPTFSAEKNLGLWGAYAGYSLVNLGAVALFIPLLVETAARPRRQDAEA